MASVLVAVFSAIFFPSPDRSIYCAAFQWRPNYYQSGREALNASTQNVQVAVRGIFIIANNEYGVNLITSEFVPTRKSSFPLRDQVGA